jgi:hypothetical protein
MIRATTYGASRQTLANQLLANRDGSIGSSLHVEIIDGFLKLSLKFLFKDTFFY